MPLQDITITSSIRSLATQSYGQKTYRASSDLESFPIVTLTGSQAGVWPNLIPGVNGSASYSTNLFVNVTQSWPGSNITPLGDVPFIHNTGDEFFNGEFSGSICLITNGSLIDEECEQFLTVNTTPVNYSLFPYITKYSSLNLLYSFLPTFANKDTIPSPGQILMYGLEFYISPPGVYIRTINFLKIARVDKEGRNNSPSLQELKSLTIVDSSLGKINLKVTSITEYQDYYLYTVSVELKTIYDPYWISVSTNFINEVNYWNYNLSGSSTLTEITNLGINPTAISYANNTYDSTAVNFNGGVYYEPYLTPNVTQSYTASLTIENKNLIAVSCSFSLFQTSDFLSYTLINGTGSGVIGAGSTKTLTFQGNYPFLQLPNSYFTEVKFLNQPVSVSAAYWIISQSQNPQYSTSSVVIEPYLVSNFANSDCDVLMNNAFDNDESEYVRRVLYENGGFVPSNINQIRNGTAEYAEVNDYIYNLAASTYPRYQGTRTTSLDFNLPSINGFTSTELSEIATNIGSIPPISFNNVSLTTTYCAYFKGFKYTYPIFLNAASPIIRYVIREDGRFSSPSTDESAYYNLIDSFPQGSEAYANILNGTTIIFNNTQSILLSGQSYVPILYTISSSTPTTATYSDNLDFINLAGLTVAATAPSFSLYVDSTQNISPPIYYNQNNLGGFPFSPANGSLSSGINAFYYNNNVLYDLNFSWDSTSLSTNIEEPGYTFDYGTFPDTLSVRVRFKIGVIELASTYNGGLKVFAVTYNPFSSISTIVQEYTTQNYLGGDPFIQNIPIYQNPVNMDFSFTPEQGDIFFIVLQGFGGSVDDSIDNISLQIESLGLPLDTVTKPFWTTGSANSTSITSSKELGKALQGGYIQKDIPNSGFDPITNACEIKLGDEIRFEYNERYTYLVTDVRASASDGGTGIKTYVTLNSQIQNQNMDLNHFTIRRKVKDVYTGITIPANVLTPISGGILLPKYPSTDLKRNLSGIINNLSERNIIDE